VTCATRTAGEHSKKVIQRIPSLGQVRRQSQLPSLPALSFEMSVRNVTIPYPGKSIDGWVTVRARNLRSVGTARGKNKLLLSSIAVVIVLLRLRASTKSSAYRKFSSRVCSGSQSTNRSNSRKHYCTDALCIPSACVVSLRVLLSLPAPP
jgi:hypothetical protein